MSNGYYLERVRLDMMVHLISQLRFFIQVQDSRAWGYDNRTALNSVQDPLDIRQGYVDYVSSEARSVQLRFGRQDITLGTGRLVSALEWSNVSRSFDAARLARFRPGVRVDFVGGSPVLIDPSRLDRHKPGEHIYASYGSLTKLVPRANLRPCLMARTTLNAAAEIGKAGGAHLYTAGVRMEGKLPALRVCSGGGQTVGALGRRPHLGDRR